MKHPPATRPSPAAFALIETAIALGVLAVTLPLAMALLTRSSQTSAATRAEDQLGTVVSACRMEARAARIGQSRFLPDTSSGQPLVPPGTLVAIACSATGRLIDPIDRETYLRGSPPGPAAPAFVVTLRVLPPVVPGRPAMLRVAMEYPSTAPASRRAEIRCLTGIP